tara:strand:- start:496 stop:768 length:273 start_codon:yes stop_codon:yes gene_type:complete
MEKNNKIIAEFMGVDQVDIDYAINEHGQLKYHLSWDWLMPVVQKIGDEYYNTPFDETYSHLTEQYENIWTLEDTYRAVVEFINNYNNQNN